MLHYTSEWKQYDATHDSYKPLQADNCPANEQVKSFSIPVSFEKS